MPRTPNARNTRPSRTEQRELVELLRTKAHAGDTLAAGLLLIVGSLREPLPQALPCDRTSEIKHDVAAGTKR